MEKEFFWGRRRVGGVEKEFFWGRRRAGVVEKEFFGADGTPAGRKKSFLGSPARRRGRPAKVGTCPVPVAVFSVAPWQGWRAAPSAGPRFPVPGGQAVQNPLAKSGKAPAGSAQRTDPTKAPEDWRTPRRFAPSGDHRSTRQRLGLRQPPAAFPRHAKYARDFKRPVRPPQTAIGRNGWDLAGECARPACRFRRRAVVGMARCAVRRPALSCPRRAGGSKSAGQKRDCASGVGAAHRPYQSAVVGRVTPCAPFGCQPTPRRAGDCPPCQHPSLRHVELALAKPPPVAGRGVAGNSLLFFSKSAEYARVDRQQFTVQNGRQRAG